MSMNGSGDEESLNGSMQDMDQLPDNQNELLAEFERRKRVYFYLLITFIKPKQYVNL